MSNKKVYLAKNVLASGFDVEYVKSSLLRIPGIDIVESGMGIEPRECSSFIIVPSDGAVEDVEVNVTLSKNVAKDLKNYYKSDNLEDTVYIFAGVGPFEDPDDVENDIVLHYKPLDLDITIEDKEDFNNYASLDLVEGEDFLYNVSIDIGSSDFESWKSHPRHPQPKPEYALPPVPTLEERRLKKNPLNDEMGQWSENTTAYWEGRPFSDSSSGNKRLLLLRRK